MRSWSGVSRVVLARVARLGTGFVLHLEDRVVVVFLQVFLQVSDLVLEAADAVDQEVEHHLGAYQGGYIISYANCHRFAYDII